MHVVGYVNKLDFWGFMKKVAIVVKTKFDCCYDMFFIDLWHCLGHFGECLGWTQSNMVLYKGMSGMLFMRVLQLLR